MKKLFAAGAFGAFIVSGFLQQAGVLPVTDIGNASKSSVALVLDVAVSGAFACGKGNSSGKGNSAGKGNGKGRN